MTRAFAYLLAAVAGVAAGATLAFSLAGEPNPAVVTVPAVAQSPLPEPPAATAPTLAATTAVTAAPATPPTTAPPPASTTAPLVATADVLLVWTPGRLPAGLAEAVAGLDGVTAVTVVRGDQLGLIAWSDAAGAVVGTPPAGYEIPVEAGAFDPATYRNFVAPEIAAALGGLGDGDALLGATSARLRGIGAGGSLELADGSRLTVQGVVDDVAIGGVEVALRAGTSPAVTLERYLLASYDGDRAALESAISDLLPAGTAARLRGPGETPVFRHGDAVLPQAMIKERFGEWAYRATSSGFEQDPAWVAEHIVDAEVPILGTVRCHARLVPALRGALAELEQRNLAFLVDPAGFRGCWNPRFIAGRRDPSRHAWGAAVDLNFGTSPTGLESAQDPRLLEVMERWGFTSGHDWLIPDPGHFEYLRPATGGG